VDPSGLGKPTDREIADAKKRALAGAFGLGTTVGICTGNGVTAIAGAIIGGAIGAGSVLVPIYLDDSTGLENIIGSE